LRKETGKTKNLSIDPDIFSCLCTGFKILQWTTFAQVVVLLLLTLAWMTYRGDYLRGRKKTKIPEEAKNTELKRDKKTKQNKTKQKTTTKTKQNPKIIRINTSIISE
jgi:hypothetical protein